jgi:hypothetical protein
LPSKCPNDYLYRVADVHIEPKSPACFNCDVAAQRSLVQLQESNDEQWIYMWEFWLEEERERAVAQKTPTNAPNRCSDCFAELKYLETDQKQWSEAIQKEATPCDPKVIGLVAYAHPRWTE